MRKVALYLNGRIHEQATSHYKNTPQKYNTFNASTHTEMADPVLLQFLKQVTQSVRSRRRNLFESEEEVSQKKQMQLLFLISSILFCTNSQCSTPFHTLVTEATLCLGGTQELVKILNRVGAAASIDTNQRLAMQVVESRRIQGILPEINENIKHSISRQY